MKTHIQFVMKKGPRDQAEFRKSFPGPMVLNVGTYVFLCEDSDHFEFPILTVGDCHFESSRGGSLVLYCSPGAGDAHFLDDAYFIEQMEKDGWAIRYSPSYTGAKPGSNTKG